MSKLSYLVKAHYNIQDDPKNKYDANSIKWICSMWF